MCWKISQLVLFSFYFKIYFIKQKIHLVLLLTLYVKILQFVIDKPHIDKHNPPKRNELPPHTHDLPGMSHMRGIVHSRPATVPSHLSTLLGHKHLLLSGQTVEQFQYRPLGIRRRCPQRLCPFIRHSNLTLIVRFSTLESHTTPLNGKLHQNIPFRLYVYVTMHHALYRCLEFP